MFKLRFILAICLLSAGCKPTGPIVTDSGDWQIDRQIDQRPAKSGIVSEGRNKSNDASDSLAVIRVGDSLAGTIKRLREYQITVSDDTGAIVWEDNKDRRLYKVSRSRTPKDALILVALRNADGSDSEIEEMYWNLDFIKQHVPKSGRPDEKHEPVQSVRISALVSELTKPPEHVSAQDF